MGSRPIGPRHHLERVVTLACAGMSVLAIAVLWIFGGWTAPIAARLVALIVVPAWLLALPVARLTLRAPWSALPRPAAIASHFGTALLFAPLVVTVQVALVQMLGTDRMREALHASMGVAALVAAALYVLIAALGVIVRDHHALQRVRADVAEAERALVEARLHALETRLQPHFLFNALHGISGLVREDPGRADTAIEQLGRLLRDVARAGAPHTLEDELRLVEDYLAIERLRLGDRLQFDQSIDDAAMETPVPPLLLLPLVENAVRHGIERRPGSGRIGVAAHADRDTLRIEIRDDGAGATTVDFDGDGIGLVALRRRLALLYGRDCLTVQTSPGPGFTVRIELPSRWHAA